MMRQKDPRINTNSFSWKSFWIQFLIIMVVCGCFLGIYALQPHTREQGVYLALSSLSYLAVISFLLSVALSVFRRHFLMKPLETLQDASRQVAQGDFSIRIPPRRKDGKKDEFEVMYEDFNTMVEELGSTEMMKKDFISNVSHELKTPIAVIQNCSSMLQSGRLSPEEQCEYAKRIFNASARLSDLVTNILQLSRLENQKIAVHLRPYNLSEQLCRCALGFEQVMDEKNIDLETELDLNIQISGDEGLLDLVWNNLLSNALKFTDENGKIRICLTTEGSGVVVSVSDTGCGMDEKTVRHIFDKFYQADTSHCTNGNGLGLALVKEVLELLGGSVQVSSTPGKGSEFKVYLPK